jgi:DNA adenine methylase
VPGTQLNYIEPFVGAGAVFFDLRPRRAIIGDTNALLIEAYCCIRDHIEALISELRVHEAQHDQAYYYYVRAQDRQSDYPQRSPVARAARLIYLNKSCYNGLYRVNRQGYFNVPVGRNHNPLICDEGGLRNIHAYLAQTPGIEIRHGDYTQATAHARPGDVVYFDPPYHSERGNNFTSYQVDAFGNHEQALLAAEFTELSRRGVYCLLSNADTHLVRSLYAGFAQMTIPAKRFINSKSDARGAVNEVLVWNW